MNKEEETEETEDGDQPLVDGIPKSKYQGFYGENGKIEYVK